MKKSQMPTRKLTNSPSTMPTVQPTKPKSKQKNPIIFHFKTCEWSFSVRILQLEKINFAILQNINVNFWIRTTIDYCSIKIGNVFSSKQLINILSPMALRFRIQFSKVAWLEVKKSPDAHCKVNTNANKSTNQGQKFVWKLWSNVCLVLDFEISPVVY